MNPIKPRSSFRRRIIIAAVLIATALGGAYLGFEGGGVSGRANQPSAATDSEVSTEVEDDEVAELNAGHAASPKTDALSTVAESATVARRSGFAGLTDEQLARFLPRGISRVDGMGGKGFNRQVKSGGIWFPVFDVSKAKDSPDDEDYDPSKVDLAEIALTISSPPPAPGNVGMPYQHVFSAVGGTPPYQWSIQGLDGSGFDFDPHTGVLVGQSDDPVTLSLSVVVDDAEGGTASTANLLAIQPSEPLQFATYHLPVGVLGEAYSATVSAVGGVPPYRWELLNGEGIWSCDESSGVISGQPTVAGETEVSITLEDAQKTKVQAQFIVKVTEGLEIITEAPLPPAAPGAPYQFSFEAAGGTPPYQWSVDGTLFPGWRLSSDGVVQGNAPSVEGLRRVTVVVNDADGRSYRKPFDLAVRKGLIAIASKEKVGLAWQPIAILRSIGEPVAGFSVTRRSGAGEVEIYRGVGNNVIDQGLIIGATYEYTLNVWTTDGGRLPYAAAQVQVMPMSLNRASNGMADPFADRVKNYAPLNAAAYGASGIPANVVGPPDGRDTFTPAYRSTEVASLNASNRAGGSIVLEFTDNIIAAGPGADFTIFENVMFEGGDPNKRFMEPAIVEVALFEGEWYRFPTSVNPPADGTVNLANPGYYGQGFAGINATTGDDPTDPNRSGGDSFDLDALRVPDLNWVRFIRITSTGDQVRLDDRGIPIQHTATNNALSGAGSSGFDLDAAAAVHP